MGSMSILLSAGGGVLRRSILQVLPPRSPRASLSDVAGRIESSKLTCSNPNSTEGRTTCHLEKVLDQLEAQSRETQELVQVMLEQEKSYQRNYQLQKKIACVLLPAAAAIWIYGLDKKEKSSAEGQASP